MCLALAAYAVFQAAVGSHKAIFPYQMVIFAELSFPFVIGTAFYVWRDFIPLNPWIGGALGVLAIILYNTSLFPMVLCVCGLLRHILVCVRSRRGNSSV